MKLEWLNPQRLEQLALGLDLGEMGDLTPGPFPEGKGREPGWVSPEEQGLRSMLAKQVAIERVLAGQAQAAGETKPVVSDWAEDYLKLRENGWPWRVAAYIAWAASPRQRRWPETVERLAVEVLGLTSARVIYSWRKKNAAIDELVGLMQAAPLLEHRADVYAALAASAANPDHRSNPDRKLFLEVVGDYTPHQKVEVSRGEVEDLSQLSDEELDELGRRVLEKRFDPDKDV